MKAFVFLFLIVALTSANALSELKNTSSNVKVIVRQCLIDYGIDPVILDLDKDGNTNVYANLKKEKKGCVTACLYKGFNWLRPDGSLDIDLLTESDTPEESEIEREKYLKIVTECRAEVGKDDCEFFNCIDMKDL